METKSKEMKAQAIVQSIEWKIEFEQEQMEKQLTTLLLIINRARHLVPK